MSEYLPIVADDAVTHALSPKDQRKLAEIHLHHFQLSCSCSAPMVTRKRDMLTDLARNFDIETVERMVIVDTNPVQPGNSNDVG